MIMKNKKVIAARNVVALTLLMLLLAACGAASNPTPKAIPVTIDSAPASTSTGSSAPATPAQTQQSAPSSAYPGAAAAYPGVAAGEATAYPGSSSSGSVGLPEPPNPERTLPNPGSNTAAIGGVLIREVNENSFLPVVPQALYLGEVLLNSAGEQALISQGTDSPQAQLFQTGVFIFNNVPPGTYALVIDVGFSQFPITDENGLELLIDVEGGKAYDLGQVMVRLPSP